MLAQAQSLGVSLVGPVGLLVLPGQDSAGGAPDAEMTENLGHEHDEAPWGPNVRTQEFAPRHC